MYSVPFSDDEKQNIKFVIQRNVYNYIGILLEGRARFEEDYLVELRRQRVDEPGPAGLHINSTLTYLFARQISSLELCDIL